MSSSRNIASPTRDPSRGLDRGWAWVICFACFVCQAILGGLVYSFALIYVELLDYFQRPKGETAWVLSIFQGISFLLGPLYSAIVTRLGCRLAISLGSCALASGFIISMWAHRVYYLYFSIGVLGGLGYGTIYLATVMGVSQYFDKRRSLATGIAVSGVGIGTLVMGPCLAMLVEEYTWKGAVLIEGAISLNCLVCGLLFRPLQDEMGSTNKKSQACEQNTRTDKKPDALMTSMTALFESTKDITLFVKEPEAKKDRTGCAVESDPFIARNDMEIGTMQREKLNGHACNNDQEYKGQNYISQDDKKVDIEAANVARIGVETLETKGQGTQLTIKKSVSKPNSNELATRSKKEIYKELLTTNVPFILILMSQCAAWLGYVVPYMYIVDTARQYHIDSSQSAWFISVMGVANTAGRFVYGILGNIQFVNRRHLYCLSLISGGVVAIVIPLSQMFAPMLCLCTLYGIISGGTLTLGVVLVVDVVDVSQSSEALGLYCASCGLTYFVGPPFAGLLFDLTGRYLATYLFAGVSFISAGLIMCCETCVTSKSASRN